MSKNFPKIDISYEVNNSKSYDQIFKNLAVLENLEKTTSVKHISNIIRPPARGCRSSPKWLIVGDVLDIPSSPLMGGGAVF